MPHMMPMLWIMLFILSFMALFLLSTLIYFFYLPKIPITPTSKNYKLFKWNWMW